jgi:uncharacterized membrane protein
MSQKNEKPNGLLWNNYYNCPSNLNVLVISVLAGFALLVGVIAAAHFAVDYKNEQLTKKWEAEQAAKTKSHH